MLKWRDLRELSEVIEKSILIWVQDTFMHDFVTTPLRIVHFTVGNFCLNILVILNLSE